MHYRIPVRQNTLRSRILIRPEAHHSIVASRIFGSTLYNAAINLMWRGRRHESATAVPIHHDCLYREPGEAMDEKTLANGNQTQGYFILFLDGMMEMCVPTQGLSTQW